MLTVCICSYNPDRALFGAVLASIGAQETSAPFDVLVIDNASNPPIAEEALSPLRERGITTRVVREETPGLIHARLRAIEETSAPWMLCVDDDNVLASGYITEGLAFIATHPDVGAFGGKLVLPKRQRPNGTVKPFLPYLAVRDAGDEVIKGVSERWEVWEPPAAGAFIERAVLEDFAAFVRANPHATMLGRAPGGFASCEDSLLMHSAYRLGRATAYDPLLRLEHHVASQRFAFDNLVRLMEGYGRSHAVLERLLRGPVATPRYYGTPARTALAMIWSGLKDFWPSPAFGYARMRYHLAAARAYRDMERGAL